jgi:hypothetical protein
MKYTGQQIRLAVEILEAFIEDKNSVVQKAETLLDFSLCDKPTLPCQSKKGIYLTRHERSEIFAFREE